MDPIYTKIVIFIKKKRSNRLKFSVKLDLNQEIRYFDKIY